MTNEELKNFNDEIISDCEKLEKDYFGKVVIADYYQLMRTDGKEFSPLHKEKKQSNQKVEVDFILNNNYNWRQKGRLYIVNYEETAEWWIKLQEHKDALREKEEVAISTGTALIGALKSVDAIKKGRGRPRLTE